MNSSLFSFSHVFLLVKKKRILLAINRDSFVNNKIHLKYDGVTWIWRNLLINPIFTLPPHTPAILTHTQMCYAASTAQYSSMMMMMFYLFIQSEISFFFSLCISRRGNCSSNIQSSAVGSRWNNNNEKFIQTWTK